MDSAFKTWAMRATRVRQRMDQLPEQKVPELQLLTEKEWFDAVKGLNGLETDEDFRKAFSNARNIARGEFGHLMQKAMRDYVDANNGELPQSLTQLKQYIDQPVDDSMFARYKLLQTGKLSDVPEKEFLIGDASPLVDEDNDASYLFSMNGTRSHSGNPADDLVKDAVTRFAAEHGDNLPTDPSQLTPYLQQPIDPAKMQSLFAKVPPGVTTLKQLDSSMRRTIKVP
jgi:hypothetical protein